MNECIDIVLLCVAILLLWIKIRVEFIDTDANVFFHGGGPFDDGEQTYPMGWYFWDGVNSKLGGGPYNSAKEAEAQLGIHNDKRRLSHGHQA